MSYQGSRTPPRQYAPDSPAVPRTPSSVTNTGSGSHTPKRRRLDVTNLTDLQAGRQQPIPYRDPLDFAHSPVRPSTYYQNTLPGSDLFGDDHFITSPTRNPWISSSSFDFPSWDFWPMSENYKPDEGNMGVPYHGNNRSISYNMPNGPGMQDMMACYNTNTDAYHNNYPPPQRPIVTLPFATGSVPRGLTIPSSAGYGRPMSYQAPVPFSSIHVQQPATTGAWSDQPTATRNPPPVQRRHGGVYLTLSRATSESIEALPEHKQECPACQLEFEPDHYVALISCCETAVHANCFSTWVNSTTYANKKVCMKCRKSIDARRPFNHVVPPLNDQLWDKTEDWNAPESVTATTKIELDISAVAAPMSGRSNHTRRTYVRRRSTLPVPSESDIPAEARSAFQSLQLEYRKEADATRARYQAISQEWQTAFENEARAAQSAADAKEALLAGTGMTQREVDGLVERCREAREVQEMHHANFRRITREQDRVDRDYRHRVAMLISDANQAQNNRPEQGSTVTNTTM